MKEMVLAAKAFADPTRVRILSLLREQELCVCELCDALAITQSTLSTHLQVIRKAGLVNTRKEGKWMYYAIRPDAKELVRSLFAFFSKSISADTAVKMDRQNLVRRLQLRANGTCCVGFGGGKPAGKTVRQ